ncbi:MAG: hypothetical protein AAF268_13980 [Cyanobacteria bacterium P01_A01_bin.3]
MAGNEVGDRQDGSGLSLRLEWEGFVSGAMEKWKSVSEFFSDVLGAVQDSGVIEAARKAALHLPRMKKSRWQSSLMHFC